MIFLEKSNNLLFRDLFVSLEVYARLPLFSSHDGFIELVDTKSIGNSMWVMESLLTGNRSEIIYRFGLMYDAVINAIQKYLDIMAEKIRMSKRESMTIPGRLKGEENITILK